MKPEVRLIDEREGAAEDLVDAEERAGSELRVGLEVPEADAVEQSLVADPGDQRIPDAADLPLEADVADATDQRRSVPREEEYE
jgi:hypothetical protein